MNRQQHHGRSLFTGLFTLRNRRKEWPWDSCKPAPSPRPGESGSLPKISIVTPSLNQGRFLETAIRSVLRQGYPNLEYFVMDGGSTDNSLEVLRKYDDRLTSWVSEPDGGQAHAINKGLGLASGEIFGWLNADDFLMPGALLRIAEARLRFPDAAAWIGDCRKITPRGRLLSVVRPWGLTPDELADWWHTGGFYQPSCYFPVASFQELGGLDESLEYALDLDLWLRLARLGRFVRMDQCLSSAVIHRHAKTQRARPAMFAETVRVLFKNGHETAAEQYLHRLLRPRRPIAKCLDASGALLRNCLSWRGRSHSSTPLPTTQRQRRMD